MKIPVYFMNIRETFKKEDCGLVSSGLSGGLKNSVSGWVGGERGICTCGWGTKLA